MVLNGIGARGDLTKEVVTHHARDIAE